MNYKLLTIVISVMIVMMLLAFIISYYKRKKYLQLVHYLEQQDFIKFDDEIQRWFIKFLFSQFNIELLRLKSAILRNDPEMIENCFDTFHHRHLNKKQKETIWITAFNYYISLENYAGAKRYVDLINETDNDQMKKEVNRIYDIYALKGFRFLEEMLSEVEKMDDTYKGVHEFLIARMYENKGDQKKADEYKKRSEKHMKLFDHKISKQHPQ